MRGYGTRLVWNSVMSTLRAPSKRSDAVSDEATWAKRRLRLGRSGARCRGAAADVVEGLVVEGERHVRVLEERVRREHRVVGLDDGVGHLGRRRRCEGELGLAAVVHGQALEDERRRGR